MSTRRPSRRQLRRRARQAHRDGYQPMMVLNSGTSSRAGDRRHRPRVCRYRSELTPLIVAVATTFSPRSSSTAPTTSAWPWLAFITAAIPAILALPLPQWARKAWGVFERPAERVYLAVVAAMLGGWLTAATAIGLGVTPMPALGGVFTLACGIPWWISRRRRSKVRVERQLEAWPDIAHTIGLPGSQVMSALVGVWGWRARAQARTRPDHPRRHREDSSDRIRARHAPRRRPRLPNRGRPRQPMRAPRPRHRPARQRDHVARSISQQHHRVHRPGSVRRCRTVPGALPASARPVRGSDWRRQERRLERPDGQPGRVRRRGHLGHRPQEGHGARPVGIVPRPPGHHARRGQDSPSRRREDPRSPRQPPIRAWRARLGTLARHARASHHRR